MPSVDPEDPVLSLPLELVSELLPEPLPDEPLPELPLSPEDPDEPELESELEPESEPELVAPESEEDADDELSSSSSS